MGHGEMREEIFRFVNQIKPWPKHQSRKSRAPEKNSGRKSKHLLLGDTCFNFIFLAVLRGKPDSQS